MDSSSSLTTRVLLVRHGQQDYDPTGPVSQIIDPPLSDLGRTQAHGVAPAGDAHRTQPRVGAFTAEGHAAAASFAAAPG